MITLASSLQFTFSKPFKSRNALAIAITVLLMFMLPSSAMACPDFSQNGTSLSYSSDDLYSAKQHKVTAGGSVDLAGCLSLPGLGHVTTSPDFTMSFSGNSAGRALEFRLDTACDSILLVNDGSGEWHYDDDSNGSLDAKLRIAKAQNGVYDIWVGTRNSDTCEATLIIETF